VTTALTGWNSVPCKRLYQIIDQRAGSDRPPLLAVSIHLGVVLRESITDNEPRADDLSDYKLCAPGDIVINRMRAFQGAIGISPQRGLVSPDYLVVRPELAVEARFLHHLFRSHWFVGEMVSRLRGIGSVDQGNVRTPRINPDDLGGIAVQMPQLAEQRAIADFLDAETGRIDALIAKKRDLIALTQERALARAYAAIRGAGEGGNRKDSGLSWLGSIPASWPAMPVAAQFEVMLGKMLDQGRATGVHLKMYLRNTNIQWDRIDADDLLLMDFPPHERLRFRVLPGDLLVCEGGEPGRAAIWDGSVPEIYYQKALHRIRSRGYSTSRWIFYCLRVAVALNVFAVEGNTTTIAHLTGEQLRAHRFPFPARETQKRLVAELDDWAVRDDRLFRLVQTQIERLMERRQALITAAVTGELPVPECVG
jgi:hypothetical protein